MLTQYFIVRKQYFNCDPPALEEYFNGEPTDENAQVIERLVAEPAWTVVGEMNEDGQEREAGDVAEGMDEFEGDGWDGELEVTDLLDE